MWEHPAHCSDRRVASSTVALQLPCISSLKPTVDETCAPQKSKVEAGSTSRRCSPTLTHAHTRTAARFILHATRTHARRVLLQCRLRAPTRRDQRGICYYRNAQPRSTALRFDPDGTERRGGEGETPRRGSSRCPDALLCASSSGQAIVGKQSEPKWKQNLFPETRGSQRHTGNQQR